MKKLQLVFTADIDVETFECKKIMHYGFDVFDKNYSGEQEMLTRVAAILGYNYNEFTDLIVASFLHGHNDIAHYTNKHRVIVTFKSYYKHI